MTSDLPAPIPENRPLTIEEHELVRWMLEHGTPQATSFLPQLDSARVTARCPCGCASVDFSIAGKIPPSRTGLEILADFEWQGPCDALFGAFVFARGGHLAGLEVWSVDGQ